MFTTQLGRLRAEIDVIDSVIAANEAIRALVYSRTIPENNETEDEKGREGLSECISLLVETLPSLPNKLDWQIHDHCAAVMRLYAAHERFINDIVSVYVGMLPSLYPAFETLPKPISINHRIGVGQMLAKLDDRERYKELEGASLVRALASAYNTGAGYSLIPEAFYEERVNYRFDILVKIFGSLDFEDCATSILHYPAVTTFMRATRGEGDTPQGEMEQFIEYRNEAAHGAVENILAGDELKRIGQFLCSVAEAISDMVRRKVLVRCLELGHSVKLGTVKEVHYRRSIVVAEMTQVSLNVGDEIFILGSNGWKSALVESLQIDNTDVSAVATTEGQELGIKLSARAKIGWDIFRPLLPELVLQKEVPKENVEKLNQLHDDTSDEDSSNQIAFEDELGGATNEP